MEKKKKKEKRLHVKVKYISTSFGLLSQKNRTEKTKQFPFSFRIDAAKLTRLKCSALSNY